MLLISWMYWSLCTEPQSGCETCHCVITKPSLKLTSSNISAVMLQLHLLYVLQTLNRSVVRLIAVDSNSTTLAVAAL